MKDSVSGIIKSQSYQKENGETVLFTSAIDILEAEFISSFIRQNNPKKTIEIGCAEGASSLVIMDALSAGTGKHTIVDPFQTTYWQSKGLNLLKKFGYTDYRLIEKGSEVALPSLLDTGEKFDFGFIDGWHTFDHTLLDAFYLIRMLNVGGILIIDDVQMPAINKCIRYLNNYPNLEIVSFSGEHQISGSRKVFNAFKNTVNVLSKVLPDKWRMELLAGSVIVSDKKLGLRSSMIALRKTAEDTREWNWWKSF
jgi:predicted O-methyltransferase YrrM